MTKISKPFFLKALILSTGLLFSFSAIAKEVELDHVVALVNDNIITQSELNQSLQVFRSQVPQGHTAPTQAVMNKIALDGLINRKLQLQLADQVGLSISDKKIDATIADIAARNNISSTELLQKLAADGMNIKSYRKELREELLIQELQQKAVAPGVMITPEEVSDFAASAKAPQGDTQYHLTDILIPLPDNASNQALQVAIQKADSVINALKNHQSLTQFAVDKTDLGWLMLEQVPTAFLATVKNLKPTQISQPIKTGNGLHVLQLLEINTPKLSTEQVQQLVFQKKYETALRKWLEKIRSEAIINLHPGN